MKKAIKMLFIVIAAFLLLSIAAIVVVQRVVDPNDYKAYITDAVRDATGRELIIEGNMELSIFPWIGLKTGPVILNNPPKFGTDPMARAEQADIQLKLIPLFHRQVMMKTVFLKGLDLRLIKTPDGKTNWEDLAGKGQAEEVPASSPSRVAGLDIQGLKLTAAKLAMEDRTTGSSFRINSLNLRTGRFKPGSPCPLDIQFNLDSSHPLINAGVDIKTEMSLFPDEARAVLNQTRLKLTVLEMNSDPKDPKAGISGAVDIGGDVSVNWGKSHVKIEGLTLDTDIKGKGIPAGATRLAAKAGVDLDWNAGTLHVSDLDAAIDDAPLKGWVRMNDFSHPQIKFDLNVGEMDLNRYLPPDQKEGKKSRGKSKAKTGQDSGRPVVMPNVSGSLRVAGLRMREMRFSDIRLKATPNAGTIPFKSIAGGKKSAQGATPLGVDLQFHLDSAKPVIRTGVDLKTDLGLFLSKGQAALRGTRLTLSVDEFNPEGQDKKSALNGVANIGGDLLVNWTVGRFKADGLTLKSRLKGGSLPGGAADADLSGNADFDWKKGTLSVTGLNLGAYDMRLTRDVKADHLLSKPQVVTDLDIRQFSPKKLMQLLGQAPPETRDPKALEKLQARFRLSASPDAIRISNLNAKLDDTALRGRVGVERFDPLKLRFDLTADQIKLDRYLRPRPSRREDGKEKGPVKRADPPEKIKTADIDGTLRVGRLQANQLKASDVRLAITGKEGLFTIKPLSANLFRGHLRTTLTADMRGETPEAAMQINLSKLEAGSFIREMFGKNLIDGGRTNLSINLKSRGDSISSYLKTLNGSLNLRTGRAILKDYGISDLLSFTSYPLGDLLTKIGQRREASRTDIRALNARFEIQGGKLLTKEFNLNTPKDRISLTGGLNLVEMTFDCKLTLDLGQRASIPIIIKGPFWSPEIYPDTAGIVTREVVEEVMKRLPKGLKEQLPLDAPKDLKEKLPLDALKDLRKKLPLKDLKEKLPLEKGKEIITDPEKAGRKILETLPDIIRQGGLFGIGGRKKKEE